MKKFRILLVAFLVLFFAQMSWALCYQVEVEGLVGIEGFGVEIVTAQTDAALVDFTVTTPLAGWMVWPAAPLGAQGINFGGVAIDASVSPVVMFNICADYDFTLGNFKISNDPSGALLPADSYVVVFNGADTYTVRSPVPIPGAFVLFGSGLLGLVAIRRRKK